MNIQHMIEAMIMVSPFLILGGILMYAVFWHSKKRWPNASWFTRYAYIITFKR